jgi:Nif-specific regulatory protein
MIGESAAARDLYHFIARVAPSDATVLVTGETGTGKELVARAIHSNSPRAQGPFVAINCAAIAENLVESEIFGHERGAFTGAQAMKKGKIEMANGGTLFLDEIAELAPALQAKLLRVLQEREFERVGGTKVIKADVRVIAATNRDLPDRIRSGAFREDLYYRLNVVSVRVPPLRERREDIALLTRHFIARFRRQHVSNVTEISPEALACLEQYSWPGNIRELENAIERALVLGTADRIVPEDLPEPVLDLAGGALPEGGFQSALKAQKRQSILAALEASRGNYTEAARRLGLHPNSLHRLIRNLGLRDEIERAMQEDV